jgi:Ni/Co efflux regulator RcnB
MRTISIALLTVASLALAGSAYAQPQKDKDDKPGHGRGGPPSAGPPGPPQSTSSHSSGGQSGMVITDRDRNTTYSYYRTEYSAGRCPPGLAKKDNGCMPPGLAKKQWEMGRPLPREVYYEELPPTLLRQLSPAPAGYQYVRVANDVLMMAIGTRMIAGAVADLSSF